MILEKKNDELDIARNLMSANIPERRILSDPVSGDRESLVFSILYGYLVSGDR